MEKHLKTRQKEGMESKKLFSVGILLAFVILFISNLPILSAVISLNVNVTLEQEAFTCINESNQVMNQMMSEGLGVRRINDSINQAQSTLIIQEDLKSKGKKTDFLPIISTCKDIQLIYSSALDARDESNSLFKFYNSAVIKGMNTSKVDATLREISSEINDERYEKVKPLVTRAYAEISDAQSSYSTVNIFYQSTARGFKAFLMTKNNIFQIKNWQVIVALFLILTFIYSIYRLKIRQMMINRKMEKLQIRKKTIKDLVMRTQKDYFQNGKISEGDYNIKIKKFAELIRDIDRQIPLLQEQLAKIERVRRSK